MRKQRCGVLYKQPWEPRAAESGQEVSLLGVGGPMPAQRCLLREAAASLRLHILGQIDSSVGSY